MKADVAKAPAHESAGADSGEAQHASGISNGLTKSVLLGAGALVLLVPVVMYFAFIHKYGVNAIYYDQWENIGLLTHTRFLFNSYSHTTLSMLWAQHGEDRMFFPNLVVLVLGRLTNMNIMTEMYVSGALLVLALALIIAAHRQDVLRTHLVFYVPVAFLVLTLGQIENTLFGFNLWLYMVIAALAGTIFLLDLERWSWAIFIAAVATAVVGSYSGIDGLAIWPAGLVVLLWKERPRRFVVTWLVSAIATTLVFFYHYQLSGTSANGGGPGYVFAHPLSGAQFFFYLIGNLMGGGLPLVGGSDPAIIAIGVVIVVLAGLCVGIAVHARRLGVSRSPVGPALICFGIFLAIVVTIGRANLGLPGAEQSRYVTEDLLILVGCYFCLLEGWPVHDTESDRAGLPRVRSMSGMQRKRLVLVLRTVAVVLVVVEVVGGIQNGIRNGPASRNLSLQADLVAAHAACAPDSLIKSALFPNHGYVWSNVRNLAIAAKKDRFSFFATSEASRFEHMKLPASANAQRPQTSVLKPTNGAILRGGVLLVAGASANCAIKAVHFQINGRGGQVKVLNGVRFVYGYVAGWSTTDVLNGVYTVQSTMRDVAGNVRTSQPVSVNVRN